MTRITLRRLAFICAFAFILAFSSQSLAGTKKNPPAKPVNLNTATASQLEELPEVGPATAKSILEFRAKSGRFRRVEDLLSIHGISRKKLEKLRPYVTVAPAPNLQQKQPAKNP